MDNIAMFIDIGSSKLSGAICAFDRAGYRVLSTAWSSTKGISGGKLVSVESVSVSLKTLLEKLRRSYKNLPREAYVTVTGDHIMGNQSKGISIVGSSNQEGKIIKTGHLREAIHQSRSVHLAQGRDIISLIPNAYYVDGVPVSNPVGMVGVRLEVISYVLTGNSTILKNLEAALINEGIKPIEYHAQPVVSSFAVFDEEDFNSGSILIDIGRDTTDIAVWHNNQLVHIKSIPIAGEYITRDIAIVLKMKRRDAEIVKIKYGRAVPAIDEAKDITFRDSTGEEHIIPDIKLAEIIGARVKQIFNLINKELETTGFKRKLSGGAAIVGGTAKLPHIEVLAREVIGMPAVRGRLGMRYIPESMNDMNFSSLWGAVNFETQKINRGLSEVQQPSGFSMKSLIKLIKDNLF